jgi:Uma2 family endonuclease
MAVRTAGVVLENIFYPETDGKPLGETDFHIEELLDTLASLRQYFKDQPNVYVAGDNMFYYEEGNPKAVVSPDVYVVRGIPKGRRRIYKLWVEKIPPCFVLEVTSRSTRREDIKKKREVYAFLGVEEYFLFDPEEEYLHPPLQGNRLVNGIYQSIEPALDGSLISHTLGLRLRTENSQLRLYDLTTGEKLLRNNEIFDAHQELDHAYNELSHIHQQELQGRQKAEEEVERLKKELEELRKNPMK